MKSLADIGAIAKTIGWGAGDILRSYYQGDPQMGILEVSNQKDGPVTSADVAANRYILQNLQVSLGTEEFAYLSEETYKTEPPSPDAPWVWVIDPLDGTRDFIDRTGEYAVHIALIHNHRPVLAVVVVPEADTLYYAVQGEGTMKVDRQGNSTPIQVSTHQDIANFAIVASRTHRDDRFNQLLQQLPCQNRAYVGSVGCKIATIVEQKADVYISLSGKSAPKDWDMAAPELILTEAGGKFTHADGSPLQYNQGDVNQWGCLIASNGHCHQQLCDQATAILEKIDNP